MKRNDVRGAVDFLPLLDAAVLVRDRDSWYVSDEIADILDRLAEVRGWPAGWWKARGGPGDVAWCATCARRLRI